MSKQHLLPQGRVVLVSGANRGIGKAIAEELYEAGFTLSLGARDPDTLHSFCSARDRRRVMAHGFEARDKFSADAWVAAALERFQKIDAVVNNAGVARVTDIENDIEPQLDEMWEVNVKGPLRLIRAAFPQLKRSGTGRAVNIVSLSGKRVPTAELAGYAMSKYAALAFTHAIRQTGWRYGIRATAVCPGVVATDMAAKVGSLAPADMIQPESIAQIVSMLLCLPNTASISEIPINCIVEHTY